MLLTFFSQSAGSTLTLADSDSQVLLSWEATKTFDSVIVSCPELTVGDTYTLTAGTAECTVTLSYLKKTPENISDVFFLFLEIYFCVVVASF